jgi:hypothetical protein
MTKKNIDVLKKGAQNEDIAFELINNWVSKSRGFGEKYVDLKIYVLEKMMKKCVEDDLGPTFMHFCYDITINQTKEFIDLVKQLGYLVEKEQTILIFDEIGKWFNYWSNLERYLKRGYQHR